MADSYPGVLRVRPGRSRACSAAPARGARRPGLRPQRAGGGPGGAGPRPGPGRLPAHGAGQRAAGRGGSPHGKHGHRQAPGRPGGRITVRGRLPGHRADRYGQRRRADPRRRGSPGPRRRPGRPGDPARAYRGGRAVGGGRHRGPDRHRAGQPGPDPPAGRGRGQPAPGARRADPARPHPHPGHVADRRAVRGGSVRHRRLGGADGGGLRPDPAPVRPADRPVPGGQAPVRGCSPRRAGGRGHLGRAGRLQCPGRHRDRDTGPRRIAAAVAAVVALDAAVSCAHECIQVLAGSATPGSIRPTATTGGPCRCARARPGREWARRVAELALDGARRPSGRSCPKTPSRAAPGSRPSWPAIAALEPWRVPPGWPCGGWVVPHLPAPLGPGGRRWSNWSSRRR